MAGTELREALIDKDIDSLRRLRARCVRGDRKYRVITRRLFLLVSYLDEINPAAAENQRRLESRV